MRPAHLLHPLAILLGLLLLPSPALAGGTALSEAEALFDHGAVASAEQAPHATLVLRRLSAELPRLEGRERTRALRILGRPDKRGDSDFFGRPAANSPLCDQHFCVHWSSARRAAPDPADADADGVPDFVEEVAGAAVIARGVQQDALGWQLRRPDGVKGGSDGRGGDGQVDIYLVDLAPGLFGYAANDPSSTGPRRSGYLVIDNDYERFKGNPLDVMRVTLAHEYNHVLQFGYDALAESWLFESTATWVEEKVFPAVDDYVSFVRDFSLRPESPLAESDRGRAIKIYGSAVWQHWLDWRYGPSAVLEVWERLAANRNLRLATTATDQMLADRTGAGFAPEFFGFAAATAEWEGSPAFPDPAAYREVRRRKLDRNGPTRLRLDRSAYSLFPVKIRRGAGIRLIGKLERGVAGGFALIGRPGPPGTAPVVAARFLPAGGRASLRLDSPGAFTRITAIAVNGDISAKRRRYLADDSRVKLRVERDR